MKKNNEYIIFGFLVTKRGNMNLLLKYFPNGLPFCIDLDDQKEISRENIEDRLSYIIRSNSASLFCGDRFKYRHMSANDLIELNPHGIRYKVSI